MNELIGKPTMQTLDGSFSTDDQVVHLGLHGRAIGTIRAYRFDATAFLSHVGELRPATLGTVQS